MHVVAKNGNAVEYSFLFFSVLKFNISGITTVNFSCTLSFKCFVEQIVRAASYDFYRAVLC